METIKQTRAKRDIADVRKAINFVLTASAITQRLPGIDVIHNLVLKLS